MDTKLILILAVAIVTLANAVVTALKIISGKNGRKKAENNPGNHGERIAKLEEAVGDLKDDVKWLRGKINGMGK